MKNMTELSLAFIAVTVALGAGQAVAATPEPHCVSVVYNQEFIKNYPQAPAACQEVVTHNGVKKLHFKARVTDVSNDAVTLTFLNVHDDPVTDGRPLVFTPPAGVDVTVNGEKVKASQLKEGDVLDFWVPENMLGFHADPEASNLINFSLQ